MQQGGRVGLTQAFREGPELIRDGVRGLDDEILDQRPTPDEWTIREIVHHLADAEVMDATRLRCLLTEDHPEIRGFDEGEFARRLHYERPIEASLDLLATSRRLSADLLEALDDAGWAREGSHAALGPYSVEELVRHSVRHCDEHADRIRATWLAVRPDDKTALAALTTRRKREGFAGKREYQLHIQIANITPPIWRRLVVPDTAPLPLVHRILQTAFGWKDYHLHVFRLAQAHFGVPDDENPMAPPIDEERVRANQLLRNPGDRCTYEYDFGDSWEHEILLEEMWGADERQPPRCTGGERAGPPEDCGGTTGYERLIAALAKPSDEEHEEMRVWAGRYSPEHCDLEAINRRLARLARGRRATPRA